MRHIALGVAAGLLLACADPNESTTPIAPNPPPPAPSADELAAIDVVLGSETGIIAEKASGQERAQIAIGDFRGLAVSPDGTRLAYTRDAKLYSSNVDGTGARKLADNVRDNPSWSPDQSRIVFRRDEGLYIVDLASGTERRLTRPQPFLDSNASWSPDGKRVAFTRYDPNFDFSTPVLAVNVDEGSETQLPSVKTIYSGMSASTPRWSPDGTRIAFILNSGVYTMNSDGSSFAKPVSYPNLAGTIAGIQDWSSDGKWLALTVYMTDHIETRIADFDGRTATLSSGKDWITVALRKVSKPVDVPSFSETVIFKGPEVTYSPYTYTQTYILYPDGKFTLRFDGPNTYSWTGKRVATGTGFIFSFDANAPRWEATATLDRNKLIIRYNTDMSFSDFVDGTFTWAPGAQP